MERSDALRLALGYANLGIPAFPIILTWDAEKNKVGKVPLKGTHGFQDASTDPEQIKSLFALASDQADVGVGLRPGGAGFFVIDVDTDNGKRGAESLALLEEQYGKLPRSPKSRSVSGGWYLWFKKPEGMEISNKGLAEHVDIRGDGGFVVAPGTTCRYGAWEWLDREVDFPECPEWIAERLGSYTEGSKEHWKEFDRSEFHELDIEMYELLTSLGGHSPRVQNGCIFLTRPGKTNDPAVSIGYIDPGVVKIFSTDWQLPDGRYLHEVSKENVAHIDELKTWLDPEKYKPWPILHKDAFHGPLGALARLVEPTLEADPAFVLTSLLVGWGVLIGKGPSVYSGPIEQSGNIFAVLVGDTASGKGASWAVSKKLLRMIDPEFFNAAPSRVLGGFGSGEALVQAVANLHKVEQVGESIKLGMDARMLIKESEFAKILRVTQREGSTYGPNICEAYDGEPLQHRTQKGGQLEATDHHIGILAHITPQELLDSLSGLEAANGFGNRFMWVIGKRSRRVPLSNAAFNYTPEELAELGEEELEVLRNFESIPTFDADKAQEFATTLRQSAALAGTRKHVLMMPSLRETFEDLEDSIVSDKPGGLAEPLIGRGRVYLVRLAMLYALADGDRFIREVHLRAAYALWEYARDTVVYLWKEKAVLKNTGDKKLDRVQTKLYDAIEAAGVMGIPKTELRGSINNSDATLFTKALSELETSGKIKLAVLKNTGKRGAPPTICTATVHLK